MTRRETVINALMHKESEHIPYHADFTEQEYEKVSAFVGDKDFIEKYGCTVIGVARNRERLSALEEKWQGSFTGVSCDASKMDEWLRLKGILDEKNISVDILINNAGILPEFKATTLTDLKECEGVMGINLFSAMYSFYALKDNVLKSKTPAIINVSSAAALSPLPGTALYSASKGGLRAYTLAMGKELGKKCYVGCVCPGFCDTEIFSALEPCNVSCFTDNHFRLSDAFFFSRPVTVGLYCKHTAFSTA